MLGDEESELEAGRQVQGEGEDWSSSEETQVSHPLFPFYSILAQPSLQWFSTPKTMLVQLSWTFLTQGDTISELSQDTPLAA